MGSARTFSALSLRLSRSHPWRVAENTSARLEARMMAAVTLTLSISWTATNRCCISSTVTCLDCTSWRTGSLW